MPASLVGIFRPLGFFWVFWGVCLVFHIFAAPPLYFFPFAARFCAPCTLSSRINLAIKKKITHSNKRYLRCSCTISQLTMVANSMTDFVLEIFLLPKENNYNYILNTKK